MKVLRELPGFDALKAKRDSQFIHRFVTWARNRATGGYHKGTDWSLLTSPSLASQFTHLLGLALQPASIRNHAFAVLQLLELVIVTPALRCQLTRGELSRLRKAIVEWTKAKRTQDRQVRRVQRARIQSDEFTPAPLYAICESLRRLKDYNILEIHLLDLERWLRCGVELENVPTEHHHAWRTVVSCRANGSVSLKI